MAQLWRE